MSNDTRPSALYCFSGCLSCHCASGVAMGLLDELIIRLPNTGPRTSVEVLPSGRNDSRFSAVEAALPLGVAPVMMPPGVCAAYSTPFAQPKAGVPAGRVAPKAIAFPE